ncbi:MAG: sugar phosphate isomerase/epimerase [Chloroflexi bacterium]|nr:sugar phosphate isomerase/epimerase [Chloroflexota bacterium]
MRCGVVGLMPPHPRDVTPETTARLRRHGFTGVSVVVGDPLAVSQEEVERAGATLRDGGIQVAQANARYEVLVHPDDERRQRGVRALQQACRVGRWLQAGNVYVRPGSLNPAGPWTPHPENTHLRTLERLARSLREVCVVAEDEGVVLAIEGGAVSPLDTPERVRDIIEAVGSPALRFNVDPVNFVRGLDDVFNTTSLVHRLFDLCGRYTVCAHAKDMRPENTLPIRIAECVIGEGLMDQVTFLRRFQECCPDGYVLIEHLPDAKIPAARAALDQAVAAAGLRWDGG